MSANIYYFEKDDDINISVSGDEDELREAIAIIMLKYAMETGKSMTDVIGELEACIVKHSLDDDFEDEEDDDSDSEQYRNVLSVAKPADGKGYKVLMSTQNPHILVDVLSIVFHAIMTTTGENEENLMNMISLRLKYFGVDHTEQLKS